MAFSHSSGTQHEPSKDQHPDRILTDFLSNEPDYQELIKLKEKGWANPAGDHHFRNQRERADNARSNPHQEQKFFKMMLRIGNELQHHTSALTPTTLDLESLRVLDLCMAPGGFSAAALQHNPDARLYGISLPPAKGGHNLLLPTSRPRPTVLFMDVTMLAAEFGAPAIPSTHPDAESFDLTLPFADRIFHLVLCDGQVLRTHSRGEHREYLEPLRLTISQLILALQRIQPGGTLVALLHKVDSWRSFKLLHTFSCFSTVQLFKPAKEHADRSSFYLVAKNVRPGCPAARQAVRAWRGVWWRATFGGEKGVGEPEALESREVVESALVAFGEAYTRLARPIFRTQRNGLAQKDYTR